jgi:hypothetical protein
MTEDEAETEWCPFAKSRSVSVQVDGKTQTGLVADPIKPGEVPFINLNCIGSGCMAWRWKDVPVLINKEKQEQTLISGFISYDASKFYTDDVPSDMHGYCGLAGKL